MDDEGNGVVNIIKVSKRPLRQAR